MSRGLRVAIGLAIASVVCLLALLLFGRVFLGSELRTRSHQRLVAATRSGNFLAVRTLLLLGVDDHGVWAEPAIWVAASEGRDELVNLLLEHRSAIDARAKGNGTPLEAAIAERHQSTALLLLRRGANPHGSGSYAPLKAAASSCQPEVFAAVLRAHGDDPQLVDLFSTIVSNSCPAIVEQLHQ